MIYLPNWIYLLKIFFFILVIKFIYINIKKYKWIRIISFKIKYIQNNIIKASIQNSVIKKLKKIIEEIH
jgi:hypothetical protein